MNDSVETWNLFVCLHDISLLWWMPLSCYSKWIIFCGQIRCNPMSWDIHSCVSSSVVVELTANCKRHQVVMRHIGKKPSAASSRQLLPGDTVSLGNGDAFWLLPEKYKHVVKFCEMNSSYSESSTAAAGSKRCADDAGISVESSSKRHSSASVASNSDRCSSNMSDDQQDSDAEQMEMVCEIHTH